MAEILNLYAQPNLDQSFKRAFDVYDQYAAQQRQQQERTNLQNLFQRENYPQGTAEFLGYLWQKNPVVAQKFMQDLQLNTHQMSQPIVDNQQFDSSMVGNLQQNAQVQPQEQSLRDIYQPVNKSAASRYPQVLSRLSPETQEAFYALNPRQQEFEFKKLEAELKRQERLQDRENKIFDKNKNFLDVGQQILDSVGRIRNLYKSGASSGAITARVAESPLARQYLLSDTTQKLRTELSELLVQNIERYTQLATGAGRMTDSMRKTIDKSKAALENPRKVNENLLNNLEQMVKRQLNTTYAQYPFLKDKMSSLNPMTQEDIQKMSTQEYEALANRLAGQQPQQDEQGEYFIDPQTNRKIYL